MENHRILPFEELKTSTITVMTYTNVQFEFKEIFEQIPITKIDVPLTKKRKNVDKKRLKAPREAVIGVQSGPFFRGVDTRKKKKHWCELNCQLTERKNDKDVKILTMVEEPRQIENSDVWEIWYYCTNCELHYTAKQLKKIPNFLNQGTIVISIGDIILNMMMFKDKIKIAGCKKMADAIDGILILWKKYIKKIGSGWKSKKTPEFVFRQVMRNVDFKLGFPIDRRKLKELMKSPEYKDKVYMAQCENTSHTSVNIKMYKHKPDGFRYKCLVIPKSNKHYFMYKRINPYKPDKKKKKKYTTFIVFSSSETILSGRYCEDMKLMYEFFIKTVMANKSTIEEIIEEPDRPLTNYLHESIDDPIDFLKNWKPQNPKNAS